MSIEYKTTCWNCKTSYIFETGMGFMLFRNDDAGCKTWIPSFGDAAYREELNRFLENHPDFSSAVEHGLYGCPKCNVIYNVEILESFTGNHEFTCNECKKTLKKLELETIYKKGVTYLHFYDSSRNTFKCRCQNCRKELLGIISGTVYKD